MALGWFLVEIWVAFELGGFRVALFRAHRKAESLRNDSP